MNVLMMTLMYPNDLMEEVSRNSKDGLQNQINSYQRAFVEGIEANLQANESLSILNALPVGAYPMHYKKIRIKKSIYDHRIQEIGCINLPMIKQKGRERRATKALLEWLNKNENNRTIVLYTIYLPFMQAVFAAKKTYPDLKASVIVTDLPNELGLSSGRTGLTKQLERIIGKRQIALSSAFDSYVLLTEPMAEALQVQNKRRMVIEGLITTHNTEHMQENRGEDERQSVLYAGTLNKELGIGELLSAFMQMPQYDLLLCGRGDMADEIQKAADAYHNIYYFGFVSQEEALRLQARATLLINPRSPEGAFTRYSFPSKTLEYMRSGKPILCYQLEGIPSDYDDYLYYINQIGTEGIIQAVQETMALPLEDLALRGELARAYVLSEKNPTVQCRKMVQMLRDMHQDDML
ncbi:MAG: glycosyltransferase family 4 protein [Clostridiales bacterium]|nr:glycosyltransferase family 4 protein [Clostridiales bacterium]